MLLLLPLLLLILLPLVSGNEQVARFLRVRPANQCPAMPQWNLRLAPCSAHKPANRYTDANRLATPALSVLWAMPAVTDHWLYPD
jgi:hypothetical protein